MPRSASVGESQRGSTAQATTPETTLLADERAWERAGEELLRVDPKRYLAILRVVEDICKIHRDPLTSNVAQGHFIFTNDGGDDLD